MLNNDSDMQDFSIKKLSENDHLFSLDQNDRRNNAMILKNFGNRWSIYALGYKEGADLLVNDIQEGKGTIDFLVYPIMFLYRHYLELTIKNLLRRASYLLDVRLDDKLENHNLNHYWNLLRPLLERVSPIDDSLHELEHIGRLIAEFSEQDKNSFAFRYPESKQDNEGKRLPTLNKLEVFNICGVQEIMGKVSSLFDGIEGKINEDSAIKADMMDDFGFQDIY